MREIVIVIRDLYLEPERAGGPLVGRMAPQLGAASLSSGFDAGDGTGADAAALAHLTRFGDKATLDEGWRDWVARWAGLPELAAQPAASVAAASLEEVPPAGAVWLATPLHLVAGLTSLHFDRRSLLRLAPAELEALAADFRVVFRGSGFDLRPLAGGELLLTGTEASALSITTEPARLPLASIAAALPAGAGAPALRRLGAEIEMWLHGHAINDARLRRGEPPIGTLWVWGGGPAARSPAAAPRRSIEQVAFGSDPYVGGLWRLAGGEARPMPVDSAAIIGEARARGALAVVEVAELLHANASWRLADAVAEIDRRLLSPALAALHRGRLDRLVLLANDRCLTLRGRHRWRLWRRARPRRTGLEGLA